MVKNLLIIALSLALAVSGWLLMQRAPVGKSEAGSAGDPVVADPVVADPVVADPVSDPLAVLLGGLAAEMPGVATGFCLLDETGAVVSGLNENTPMIPASSFKTLTTVAALDLLGPESRFSTNLESAEAVGGSIPGDLVIRGGGDPMLAMVDLEAFADVVQKAGVASVEGGVVGDGALFPASMAGDFWGWGDVGNGYGSPTSGLNLEHNRFVAVFRPGKDLGEKADFLGARPEVPGVEWLNLVTTGPSNSGDGVMIYGGPLATRVLLTGTVPMGAELGVRGAIPDPPYFAAFHLDRLLKERGIRIGRAPKSGRGSIEMDHVWVAHESPSLEQVLPGLHGRSDNHETECLFQMMGVKAGRPAAEVLTEYWKARGVEGIRVVDGSGLSRADFVSAEGLARVQWVAGLADEAGIYRSSLSLSNDGKARWKVGGMSSVRSWTGFVEGQQGRGLSFALIFNHYQDGSRLEHWRDELLKAAAER